VIPKYPKSGAEQTPVGEIRLSGFALRTPGPYEREPLLAYEFMSGTLSDARHDSGESSAVVAPRFHIS
jgi:hypothetical protein